MDDIKLAMLGDKDAPKLPWKHRKADHVRSIYRNMGGKSNG